MFDQYAYIKRREERERDNPTFENNKYYLNNII